MVRQATAQALEEVLPVREQFFPYGIGENASIQRSSETGRDTIHERHFTMVVTIRLGGKLLAEVHRGLRAAGDMEFLEDIA